MGNARVKLLGGITALFFLLITAVLIFNAGKSQKLEIPLGTTEETYRLTPSDVIADIEVAVIYNKHEEYKPLESSLASFREDALPEIGSYLDREKSHPRAKLVLLKAAARMDCEESVILLKKFIDAPGHSRERWLKMTAVDLLKKMNSPSAALAVKEIKTRSSRPSAPRGSIENLVSEIASSGDRKRRLELIDNLSAIPDETGSKGLEEYILDNQNRINLEWEVNRAIRVLIEKHSIAQEIGPFRWVLQDDPISVRVINIAAQMKNPAGLEFLTAARELLPVGHRLRLRAEAALARRKRIKGS